MEEDCGSTPTNGYYLRIKLSCQCIAVGHTVRNLRVNIYIRMWLPVCSGCRPGIVLGTYIQVSISRDNRTRNYNHTLAMTPRSVMMSASFSSILGSCQGITNPPIDLASTVIWRQASPEVS